MKARRDCGTGCPARTLQGVECAREGHVVGSPSEPVGTGGGVTDRLAGGALRVAAVTELVFISNGSNCSSALVNTLHITDRAGEIGRVRIIG